jgi:hypothetical protein
MHQSVTIWVKLCYVTTVDSKARQHLAAAIENRQADLDGITLRQIAKAGGISYETIRGAIRGPKPISDATRRAIERGLGWPPGGTDEALAGKQPVPLDTPDHQDELPPPSPWAEHAVVVRPDLVAAMTVEDIKRAAHLVKEAQGEQAASDFLAALFKIRNQSKDAPEG